MVASTRFFCLHPMHQLPYFSISFPLNHLPNQP